MLGQSLADHDDTPVDDKIVVASPRVDYLEGVLEGMTPPGAPAAAESRAGFSQPSAAKAPIPRIRGRRMCLDAHIGTESARGRVAHAKQMVGLKVNSRAPSVELLETRLS
jgi:hypothetical protein